jgi:hypothetical protein
VSPVGRDGETDGLVGKDYSGNGVDDYEDEIGQALINVVRKGSVVIKQVVGVGGVGRVGLCGALALVGLIHVTLFGCIVDLDVPTNALSGETGEPFQIIFIDCIG